MRRRRSALTTVSLICAAAWVAAHGAGGPPTVVTLWPARGAIEDVTGPAALRWFDNDPDDNASVSVWVTPDPASPAGRLSVATNLPEDCDPADGGPLYTGVNDAGEDVLVLTAALCETGTGCTAGNDCAPWDPGSAPTGVYFVSTLIHDHWPDGGGGTESTHTSLGVLRVTQPGDNVPPALVFLEPDGLGDIVDTCFHARWTGSDPDDPSAVLDLFLQDLDGGAGPTVATNVPLSQGAGGLDVHLDAVADRTNWLLAATLRDGHHPAWTVRSRGPVTRFVGLGMDGGCSPVVTLPDASTPPDAAEPADAAGDPDAAPDLPDAATPQDAATPDAAPTPDAASTPDAAPTVDAAVAPDAAPGNPADASTVSPADDKPGCPGCGNTSGANLMLLGLLLVLRRR